MKIDLAYVDPGGPTVLITEFYGDRAEREMNSFWYCPPCWKKILMILLNDKLNKMFGAGRKKS